MTRSLLCQINNVHQTLYLEAIASLMHENGTRWLKARLEDDSPSRLKPADLHDDMVPDFITDDIINKTKLLVVQEGHYRDPFSLLKEAVSAANQKVNDDELQAIASLMHENGTRWLKARLEDGSPSRLRPADLQDDIAEARRRVRDELILRGVREDNARNVADVWCNQFQDAELQGRIMESYIFLIWIVGVNFKGPYHQVEHWTDPSKPGPIPDNSMPNDKASDLISSKFQRPSCHWSGKGQPSTSVKRVSATQRTSAISGDEEFERRNVIVPEWAKMGSLDLRTEPVLRQTEMRPNILDRPPGGGYLIADASSAVVQVPIPGDLLDEVEGIYAPPNHPVFELVPPMFKRQAQNFYAALGKPPVSSELFWDVYQLMQQQFEALESDHNLTVELSQPFHLEDGQVSLITDLQDLPHNAGLLGHAGYLYMGGMFNPPTHALHGVCDWEPQGEKHDNEDGPEYAEFTDSDSEGNQEEGTNS
ncbi:uncharacterized protein F5891DRAFT_1195670 [Suillus fuscotomentosus]|uniref:Uncharacterized protein n=1 Tax=Suillus fuscotomentosus TaxID=1912939 RepID=A0AAD4DUD8_9AGAM|nr:uncharacterized protein F5891DRAFT_1196802 [Suillus fuscotomentosus]XP_041219689.1 uncharacterized protein F5891DRAFT_1195670 [Suillus fuscotomentosus]KAG1893171.1 hypothetical protein F5891DRAFT_1196802 [Suillus fuscotomentosus]KAG1894113.1 hypothetical protein F5891DRAFT_1195670 [Suillus fuscotomentosus]